MIGNLVPTSEEHIHTIKEGVPIADIYDQLAEEAAELAQAAGKMARVIRGTNPTPKNEREAYNNMIEEYTDVVNVAGNVLDIHPDWLVGEYKLYRWAKRIEGMEIRNQEDKEPGTRRT